MTVYDWAERHRAEGHHPHPAPTAENPERWDCDCGGVWRILTERQIRQKFAHLQHRKPLTREQQAHIRRVQKAMAKKELVRGGEKLRTAFREAIVTLSRDHLDAPVVTGDLPDVFWSLLAVEIEALIAQGRSYPWWLETVASRQIEAPENQRDLSDTVGANKPMTYSQAHAYYRATYPDASCEAIAVWCRGHPQGGTPIVETDLHPMYQQRLRESRQNITEMRMKLAAEKLRIAFTSALDQTASIGLPIDVIPQRVWTRMAEALRAAAEKETGAPWWLNEDS